MPLLCALRSHLLGPQIDYFQLLALTFLCLSLGTSQLSSCPLLITTMYISKAFNSVAEALRQSNKILPSVVTTCSQGTGEDPEGVGEARQAGRRKLPSFPLKNIHWCLFY